MDDEVFLDPLSFAPGHSPTNERKERE
jgi:hypothetical protein